MNRFFASTKKDSVVASSSSVPPPAVPPSSSSSSSRNFSSSRIETSSQLWACTSCTFQNAATLNICEMCGMQFVSSCSADYDTNKSPQLASQDEFPCPQCTFLNSTNATLCEMCGYKLIVNPKVSSLANNNQGQSNTISTGNAALRATTGISSFLKSRRSTTPQQQISDFAENITKSSSFPALTASTRNVDTKDDNEELQDTPPPSQTTSLQKKASYVLKSDPGNVAAKRRISSTDLLVPPLPHQVLNRQSSERLPDANRPNKSRLSNDMERDSEIEEDEDDIDSDSDSKYANDEDDDSESFEVYSIVDSEEDLSDGSAEQDESSDVEFLPDAKLQQREKKLHSLIHSDDEDIQQFDDSDDVDSFNHPGSSKQFVFDPLARVKEIPPAFPQVSEHYWSVQQLSRYKCCSVDFNMFTLDGGVTNPNCPPTTGRSKRRTDNSNIDSAYDKRKRLREAKQERAQQRRQEKVAQKAGGKRDRALAKYAERRKKIVAKKFSQQQKKYAGYGSKKTSTATKVQRVKTEK